MSINETVLEMHYHKPLLDLFRNTVGIGKGKFNFYKYSTQRECFVGFDQAYVQTDLSEDQLFNQLRESAINNGYSLSNFFVGFFLQFKVVKILQNRAKYTPRQIRRSPHYRVSLDTKKNINTGFSQHELLYKLNRNNGAFVYYACPMLFERSDLYVDPPDIDTLRFADLTNCPSSYSDNASHFIYFNETTSNPIWCSDPVEGHAISPKEFVSQILQNVASPKFYEKQLSLLYALEEQQETEFDKDKIKLLNLVEESFTIIQYSEEIKP